MAFGFDSSGTCLMGGGYMGFGYGWIFQLLIFVVFFLVVWWLIRNNPSVARSGKDMDESPSEILKRRLAKGEISKKEYNELKKEIR